MRASTLLFLLVATLLVHAPALASEHLARAGIEWTSSDGCIDSAALRQKTESALGRPAFDDANAELIVRGRAGAADGHYEATITLAKSNGDVLGTRTLTSDLVNCTELSAGLPLALALMIDVPLREATIRVSLPAPPPPRPPPPPAAPRPPPPSTPLAFDAGPVMRLGSLPHAAIGVRVSGELSVGPVPIGIEASWFAPRIEDDGLVTASVWGLTGAVFACPLHVPRRRVFFGFCGVVEAGAAIAQGVSITFPREDVAPLLLAGARARAGFPIADGWTVGFELTGGAFLVRPHVIYRMTSGDTRTLADADIGSVDGRLVIGIRLP